MKFIIVVAFLTCSIVGNNWALPLNEKKLGSSRIIGGEIAFPCDIPYIVSVEWVNDDTFMSVCGGAILNRKVVLTAGHCIHTLPKDTRHQIRAGILNLYDKGHIRPFTKTIIHPKYKGGVSPNDIALIILDKKLKFKPDVMPVNLPSPNAKPTGIATASGWGLDTAGSLILPDDLQYSYFPIITNKECEKALTDMHGSADPLDETMICTMNKDPGHGACLRDSGGPLVHSTEGLIGIVSWGLYPCARANQPSVYTRVSSFMDFIQEHLNDS